jgi:glutathione S-transferase
MELFFSPLACSMASRITLYEAGATATFTEVDAKTKRTLSGLDYFTINPLGLVPALRLPGGEVLFENAAILQALADLHSHAELAPRSGFARSQLHQWLSFIGTELHKSMFIPLFDKTRPAAERDKTLTAGEKRLAVLETHLQGREFLLDAWSVADAYLTTVLNWHQATDVDLARWPAVKAYFERMRARPATAKAMAEEGALYAEELRRHRVQATEAVSAKHRSLASEQVTILGSADTVAIATKEVIRKFHAAFDRHDPGAMAELVADDCVIENTSPAPNGARLVGKAECLANWQGLARSTDTWFLREEVFVVGERAVVRWRYCWGDGDARSVRGLNLMRVREGRIVEALGYVKG